LKVELKKCLLSFYAGFLSFGFLNKNIKVEIYTTIILPVVFYRFETWSFRV
jgi:hypothetical protein